MKRMKRMILAVAVLAAALPSEAQVFTFTREQMMEYTAKNPYERFADGRPKVPDSVLERMQGLSAEEVWGVLPGAKYPNQYEGNWRLLHPGKKLIGRAVTAQFMPYRPDVADVSEAKAHAKGLGKNPNQRVIDMLQPGDVVVVRFVREDRERDVRGR
jgi:4-hydroxy-4-methyl-2-oxoglutarate aldolase